MLALLIQSIYNIVDSYFVAQYSLSGLTALSLVFPIQLLATALATGAGTGLGILIARMDGCGDRAASGTPSRAACGWECSTSPCSPACRWPSCRGTLPSHRTSPWSGSRASSTPRWSWPGRWGCSSSPTAPSCYRPGQHLRPHAGPGDGSRPQHRPGPHPDLRLLGAPAMGVTGAALAHRDRPVGRHGHHPGAVCRSCDLTGRVRLHLCAGSTAAAWPPSPCSPSILYTLWA